MTTNSTAPELHGPETASTLQTVAGSHRLTIIGYSLNKGIGPGNYISSESFVVGGYHWAIVYYPDGYLKNESVVSFGLELKSCEEEKEVKARFNIIILDQSGNPSTLTFQSQLNTFGSKIKVWHSTKFVAKNTFETSNCLKNDSFTILCGITVLKPSRIESMKCEPAKVPPTNLDMQLVHLLESGRGTDVTFEVNEECFKAHKCVLAARSPVFNAQFYGPMNENEQKNIVLDDIEPEVFRVLLHFMYSDSVHELVEGHPMMYQHLLVVADRYEVQRLKLICENELSKNLEIKNWATTLTLAEQHNYPELKASCFKFISSLEILAKVLKTDGFEHLNQSCPFILKEIVENLSCQKKNRNLFTFFTCFLFLIVLLWCFVMCSKN